ncbi:MAG: LysR family transcriptional regulator [Pseudomonadota bacterium]
MARNLDLPALRSFLVVAETGGVTKAAQRLHLTQSAVSMQLKRLEQSLSCSLLNRAGRGVSLTRQGEELLSLARRLISLNDEIWDRMTVEDLRGEVRFGAPHDIIYPHVPSILRRFNEDFPGARVSLISQNTETLHEMLAAGEVDVITTTEYGVRDNGETLETKPLVWMGAPGGRAWRRTPIPLGFEGRCAFRRYATDALARSGLESEDAVHSSYHDAALATIVADLAVSAQLRGAYPGTLEEIDHGGALPGLPNVNINLYAALGREDDALAVRLAEYVRDAYQARRPDGRRAA